MVAGVCGGIARYLEVDPTLVRLIWAVFSLPMVGFIGVPAYILCWAIIPPEPAAI
jgi:phage shock protein C